MRITIDTKQDSHEDIRKVLHILTHLVKSETETPVETANMMNMFDNQPQEEEKAPDFSSFLNLTEKKDEDKDEGKVELY